MKSGMSAVGMFLSLVSLWLQFSSYGDTCIMCIVMILFQLVSFIAIYNAIKISTIRNLCISNYVMTGIFLLVSVVTVLCESKLVYHTDLTMGCMSLIAITTTIFFHIHRELYK